VEFLLLFLSFPLLEHIQRSLSVVPGSLVSVNTYISFVYAFLLSCGSLAMGVYLSLMREGFMAMFFRTLVAYCFLGALALSLLSIILPAYSIGGSNLFWVIMLSTGMALVVRKIFSKVVDSDQLSRRVVVLGTNEAASTLQQDYERNKRGLTISIVGYIGDNEGSLSAEHCIEAPADWLAFCKANRITEIVVAQQERRRSDGGIFPMDELISCKLAGIDVIDAVSFYERELNQVKLDLLQPSWIIFSDGFRASYSRDISKRCFDLFISILLAVVLLPLVTLAALLVFFETGRPILYSQVRTGLNGKPFKIYKIRSMRQDAEKGGKAVWAKANDSRITRVGAFIRNTRLDEIPQLWNVLKGDMSFVGPRPERPEFVDQLNREIPFYNNRHAVKPGLMGWAQLNYPYGASVEDARGKLEYDLYYTKNHSLIMDFLIMIQTVEVVLLGKGVR
jgi:sugar transferase (PEP-CTERM system associated)